MPEKIKNPHAYDADATIDTHESYGMLRIGRHHGGIGPMFGSALYHNECISMTISHGECKRNLHNDWYSDTGRPIIEIQMSASQFAEVITSLNNGTGTPCTITRMNNADVAKCPYLDRKKQYVDEFGTTMNKVSKTLDELMEFAQELRQKGSVTKKDRDELIGHISQAKQDLACNVPFITQCFSESMDDLVMQARNEIEAAVAHKTHLLGEKALRLLLATSENPSQESMPLLPAPSTQEPQS